MPSSDIQIPHSIRDEEDEASPSSHHHQHHQQVPTKGAAGLAAAGYLQRPPVSGAQHNARSTHSADYNTLQPMSPDSTPGAAPRVTPDEIGRLGGAVPVPKSLPPLGKLPTGGAYSAEAEMLLRGSVQNIRTPVQGNPGTLRSGSGSGCSTACPS